MIAAGRTRSDFSQAPADSDLSTENQRLRRTRILNAAVDIAGSGGYGAFRMRAVAERSGVAIGTLYRHFPAKDDVLLAALERELGDFSDHASGIASAVADPYLRLQRVLATLTSEMEAHPLLTHALASAFVRASTEAGADIERIHGRLAGMLTHLMSGEEQPSDYQCSIGELFTDIWTSEILAFAHHRTNVADIRERLDLTIAMLRHNGRKRHRTR